MGLERNEESRRVVWWSGQVFNCKKCKWRCLPWIFSFSIWPGWGNWSVILVSDDLIISYLPCLYSFLLIVTLSGCNVIFSYELQLDNHLQRKGLGKFMMQILELIAFKNNMKKVVLTVLKNNNNSKFFKAIGYVLFFLLRGEHKLTLVYI